MANITTDHFNADTRPVDKSGCPAPIEIDLEPYLGELRDYGATDEQAAELLATLVSLIWHFVDLGFRGDISELLLSEIDSGAVDSKGSPSMKTPSKAESEIAKQ